MWPAHLCRAMLVLLAIVRPIWAADLGKIDRTLKDQPAYKSGAPQYCLLVFGPEAKTQVWIVLDGKLAHVYASPNGSAPRSWRQVPVDRMGFFGLGDVWEADGKTRHTQLCVRPTGFEDHTLGVMINGKHEQHAGRDRAGILRFAAKPKEAPIVHFNGPLTLDLYFRQKPLSSEKAVRLLAAVGTPGYGAGTFANFGYDKLYKQLGYPIAEVEYPDAKPGGPPIRANYRLTHGMGEYCFGEVRAPQTAGRSLAKVKLSFDFRKDGSVKVAPAIVEIPVNPLPTPGPKHP